jgi:hypothetical protein
VAGLGSERQLACPQLRGTLRTTQGCAPGPFHHGAINTVQIHTAMPSRGPQSPGKDLERGPGHWRPNLVDNLQQAAFSFPAYGILSLNSQAVDRWRAKFEKSRH